MWLALALDQRALGGEDHELPALAAPAGPVGGGAHLNDVVGDAGRALQPYLDERAHLQHHTHTDAVA